MYHMTPSASATANGRRETILTSLIILLLFTSAVRMKLYALSERLYHRQLKVDAISWMPNTSRVSTGIDAVNWWPMAMHLDGSICGECALAFHWSITLSMKWWHRLHFCREDNHRAFMFSLPVAISSENKSSECATFAKYEHLNVENGTLSFYSNFCVDVDKMGCQLEPCCLPSIHPYTHTLMRFTHNALTRATFALYLLL